jgi:hypothetical protein
LHSRKERFERRIKFLRDLVTRIMQAAGLTKRELTIMTFSMRNNPQQIVGDPDPAELPDEFVRIKREADKVAIRDALLAGREVPGCTLSNAPPSLVVKVK